MPVTMSRPEQTDVRWAQTCMTLEDTVEQLGAQLSPVLVRRMQDKLWQALYFGYDYAAPFLPQLEKTCTGWMLNLQN